MTGKSGKLWRPGADPHAGLRPSVQQKSLPGVMERLPAADRFNRDCSGSYSPGANARSEAMDSIIYLVGLVVIILFILSALGLR